MSTIIFNFLLTISTALNCFDNDNYYTWISLPRQHFFWFLFIFFVCFTILMIINVIQPFQKGCNDPFVIDYEWTSLTQLIYTYNKYIFQKLLKVLNAPSQHFSILLHFNSIILLHKGELLWQLLLILYYTLMFI